LLRIRHISSGLLAASASWITPAVAWAAEEGARDYAVGTGANGLWVLCNVSYAGMRAQNHSSRGWRAAAFIFGLPGTVLTYFVVTEGSDRAYGIDLPPRRPGARD